MIEFEAAYTEGILVRAACKLMVRRIRWVRWIAAYALLALGTVSLLWSGDGSWVVGVCLVTAVMPLVLLAVLLRMFHKQARDSLQRMGQPVASIALTDDALHITSGQGRGELPWRTLHSISPEPGYWVLLSGREAYIILPSAAAPDGALEFAQNRIAAAARAS